MTADVPILNASKAPECELYVMQCTLTVEHIEIFGGGRKERKAQLNSYLSKEVLESALDIMREVVSDG